MPKRFHLGWFVNFTAGAWDSTFSHGGSPWDGQFYVEFAQALTGFDSGQPWHSEVQKHNTDVIMPTLE